MKKIKIALLALVVMAVPLFALISTTYAHGAEHMSTGGIIRIDEEETINHSLYLSGEKIEVHGKVNGDIFCAGSNVTIDADVTGDVLCVGQTVTISGKVNGSVRAAGQNLVVNAVIARSASLAGNTVNVSKDARIASDLQLFGSDLTVEGSVQRDATIDGATSTVINGAIGRDLSISGDTISLDSGATVHGDITYTSAQELTKKNGAVVGGEITRNELKPTNDHGPVSMVARNIGIIAAFLGLTLLLTVLFPRLFKKATVLTKKQPGAVALTGVVAGIVMPVVIVASFASMILLSTATIFIGFGLLFAWLTVILVSVVFAGHYIGELILMKAKSVHPVLSAVVGVAALTVLLFIPVLGVIVLFLASIFGIGIVVNTVLKTRTSTTKKSA